MTNKMSSLASVRNTLPPSDQVCPRIEARASIVRATTCLSGGSPASAFGRRQGLAGSEQPSSIAEGAREAWDQDNVRSAPLVGCQVSAAEGLK